jgi:hypothetical protein
MNIGTATAPPANGVDDVNHADASGTAAVNKDSCLITVQTTKKMTLNCWHARATTWLAKQTVHEPRRRASRIDSMLRRAIRHSYLSQYASTRSICAESEHFATTTSIAPNDKSTLTLDDVRTTK